MFSYATIYKFIATANSGRSLKHAIGWMRLKAPANVTSMLQRGEHPAYIAAACIALDQVGA